MVFWIDYLRGASGLSGFGSKSTAEDVTEDLCLSHLTVIVTGATSGIGAEAARVLAKRGARIVIPARNLKAAQVVKEKLQEEITNARIIALVLDLSSFTSIRFFVMQFLSLDLPLNILINNAGVCSRTFKLSDEGYEMNFATNHLGHFLLTNLLLEKMVESARGSGVEGRIVNVASCLHTWVADGGIDLHKLNDEHSFVESTSYAQSKLANILHAKELARRLKEVGAHVTANSLHPGIVKTNITRDRGGLVTDAILSFASIFMKTIPQGAAAICYVATHPNVAGVSGKYFVDCNESQCSSCANDGEQARELWCYSEKATSRSSS